MLRALLTCSTRKELKIRPGFTPQEDIGLYRSSRQQSTPSKASVPGSNKPAPPSQKSSDNVFAQPAAAKTKAQLKNEKRRERKREAGSRAWDEESSDEEEGLREAFEKVDMEHKQDKAVPTGEKGSEETYPRGGGGAPEPGVMQEAASSTMETNGPGEVSILEPAAGPDGPESASQLPDAPPPPSASTPATNPAKPKAKPHPIQGGRQGPIGLAFPPPVEESKPRSKPASAAASSRADEADSWRQAKSREQRPKGAPGQARTNPNNKSGSSGQSRPPPGTQAAEKTQAKGNSGLPSKSATPATPATPEPRVRKEHKVKQGGANDLSSLASRVKNLVLDSATPRKTGSGPSKAPKEPATPA